MALSYSQRLLRNGNFCFRNEVDRSGLKPSVEKLLPGNQLPKKLNAYDESRDDNHLVIMPSKSLENSTSFGTPTSQATIVDKSHNEAKMRPPLLRKPNKEVTLHKNRLATLPFL